jgi:PEP-CTERM motif
MSRTHHLRWAALVLAAALPAAAQTTLQVTVHNLAAASGIAFAPLHVGFHGGSFDPFDLGGVAGEAIVSVAEGGAGGAWQAAFAAADPTATRGTIGGLLLPGASATLSFVVDPLKNPYFSFGSMVVPSNDFFIGNDAPTEYRLFDAGGQLQLGSIVQRASEIWDAGSEVFDPAAAAFVGDNDLRADQNSVVAFNFGELAGFNGLTTGAGYVFHSGLAAGDAVYRIDFSVTAVPEPGTWGLMAAGLLAVARIARRRRPL